MSSQATLNELFSEYNDDALPPMQSISYSETDSRFGSIRRILHGEISRFNTKSILLARDRVIIGWKIRDLVAPLSDPAGKTDHVFDTKANKFVTLDSDSLLQLGVGRRFSHVVAEQQIGPSRHNSSHGVNHQVYEQGTHLAISGVNRSGIYRENSQVNLEANIQAFREYENYFRRQDHK